MAGTDNPVTPTTQIGVANGTDEGYASLSSVAARLPVTDPTNGDAAATIQQVIDNLNAAIPANVVDTFSTLSGQVITFASGATVTIPIDTDTDTFASISGSVITFADGTTFDLSALDTDTFADFAGGTITFANGATVDLSSIDTDTFSTISGSVITFADGETFDLSTLDTDTDTFSTFAGSVITFADGSTADLSTLGVDTFATFAGSTITFADGTTVDLSTIDTDTDTFSTLAGSTITFADGSTVDLSSIDTDTDTFATVAGNVITFADGSTLTIPNGSTIIGQTITTSDGNSFDLSSLVADTVNQWSGSGTQADPYIVADPDGNPLGSFVSDTVTTSSITVDVANPGYLIHSDGAPVPTLTQVFGGYPSLSVPVASGGLGGVVPTTLGPLFWTDDSVSPECIMFWDSKADNGAGGNGVYAPLVVPTFEDMVNTPISIEPVAEGGGEYSLLFTYRTEDGTTLPVSSQDTFTIAGATSGFTVDPDNPGFLIHSDGADTPELTQIPGPIPRLSDTIAAGGFDGTPPTEPGPLFYIDDNVSPECYMVWDSKADDGGGGNGLYVPFGGSVTAENFCLLAANCPGTTITHEVPAACSPEMITFLANCLRDAGEIA